LIKKTTVLFYSLLAAALILSACQAIPGAGNGAGLAAPTPIPTLAGEESLIVEGKLVPAQDVTLSFNLGGQVAEVLVEEGQSVEAGQLLAELDRRPQLAAAVAAAELEQVAARQALKTLEENAGVSTAAAAQKMAAARDAVRDAQRYLDNLIAGGRQTDIDKARANLVLLKDRLDQAREDWASYENKPEDNLTRAAYLSRLADAQRRYDDAVLLLNNLEGSANEIDLAVAESSLALAQADLALAELEYADVAAGPDPDLLEAAQARLNAADAAVEAARATLADAGLTAPFSGVIVRLDIKAGEQAVPGKPAVALADFSTWKVETDDLNEMELPRVSEGAAVTITPDALPDLELPGVVESIAQYALEKRGDVTYTATIRLEQGDPRLRWGMTVSVKFAR
jgi:multidrug resistance efflux pump/predicted small secreted protein